MSSSQHFSAELSGEIRQASVLQQIAQRVRQSLELPEILAATVMEVRSFLETDRVMVYRFHEDGSGEVVAESLGGDRLPSLQGLNFPADDIPEFARQIYIKLGMTSIVRVDRGSIAWSSGRERQGDSPPILDIIETRPVDPCHLKYLKAMGVQSSVVFPLQVRQDFANPEASTQLWGLLISHHSEPHNIESDQLQILQWVSDQVEIAIAQAQILSRARQQMQQQAAINRVSNRLHSLETIQLQHALSETVAALQGSGGRLYIAPTQADKAADLYTCGSGEEIVERKIHREIEEHPVWQKILQRGTELNPAVSPKPEISPVVFLDLYKVPALQPLAPAFAATPIRGLLIFPLYYRQQLLGSLSIFRDEIETETLWAGYPDGNAQKRLPRQSFEVWRERKKGQPQAWTAEDLTLGTVLAQQFAIAIEQHQLYHQVHTLNSTLERTVEERTAQLKQSLEFSRMLGHVTEQIRSSLDLDTTLQTVVREVRNLLDTDRMIVYQFKTEGPLEAIVEEVKGDWISVFSLESPSERFCQEDLRHFLQGRVQAIDNVFSDSHLTSAHRQFLQHLRVQATLIVPICIGSGLWGLLVANECKAPRVWQEAEIKLLQQLADRVAVAINQAQLYQESSIAATLATKRAFELERVAEQQRTLFRTIGKIRESLDLKAIFEATTTEVRKLLHADRAGIFRFKPESEWNEGEFVAEDVKPAFTSALTTAVCDRCFGSQFAQAYQQGMIQAIDDIEQADLSDCHQEILERFQIRANLVVPLNSGEQLWGLLCIHQCSKPRQWTSSDIEFARQIAAHLGVALQQSSLLAQTQQQKEELARALADLQKTQTKLIQTEKMSSLGQLVAGVAHEINNPVNFIYGNLTYLEEYAESLLLLLQSYRTAYPNPTPELAEQQEDIELDFLQEDLPKIVSSLKLGTERIRQLVVSLRNFSRLDEAERKPVNIHEGIDSTLLILQHRWKGKDSQQPAIEIVKDYGDLPPVECYAGQLNQVFMNILSNAIDAIEERGEGGKITIRTQLGRDRTQQFTRAAIEISDNGKGMPESVLRSIFDPFFTTKPLGKGTGLGLAISYQIVVEKHGGSLKCDSQLGRGTTFKIKIPLEGEDNRAL